MNRRFFVATAGFALAGCAQRDRAPEDYFYRLRIGPAPRRLSPPALDGALVVKRFAADGVIGERAVAYTSSERPQVLQRYHYHLWVDSPTRLVQEEAVEYLRSAGIANPVVTPDIRTNADYELSGRIQKLDQILGTVTQVEVALELVLRRVRDDALLVFRNYSQVEPAQGTSVAAAVAAMSLALTRVLEAFVSDVAAL